MRFEVTILGAASAKPTADRHPSAQVINVGEQLYLLDAGEGVQGRLFAAGINPLRLRGVFISHLHGDHVYGLFPLISTLGLYGKRTPLRIFGPSALGEIIEAHLRFFDPALPYKVEFTAVDTSAFAPVFETRTLTVLTVPLRHRVPTVGYLFRIKDGRSYAYLSDTAWSPPAAERVAGVSLLYHEATYADAERRTARARGHSTALEAARIAEKAGAGQLLIGHYSSRYKDVSPLVAEARTVFDRTEAAVEGKTYSI